MLLSTGLLAGHENETLWHGLWRLREICKISPVWIARFGDGLWIPGAQKLTGSPLLPLPPSLWETAIVWVCPVIEDLRLWEVRRFSEIVYRYGQFPVFHKTHHHILTCMSGPP
jgi:hypothetical protein